MAAAASQSRGSAAPGAGAGSGLSKEDPGLFGYVFAEGTLNPCIEEKRRVLIEKGEGKEERKKIYGIACASQGEKNGGCACFCRSGAAGRRTVVD